MVASFYIIPESFSQENLSNEQYVLSLQNFISDYHNFIEHKDDNKIIIQDDVYSVTLPNGKTLGDFLYSTDSSIKGREKSLKKFLSSVFSKLPNENIDIAEIKERIKNNSIEKCVGVISLSIIDEIADENQVIYDKDSWLHFRRFHLGLYFGDEEYFINECKKYYSKLYFHENNYTSISKILKDFSGKIIFHLNGLNDKLPELVIEGGYNNHTELLGKFSVEAKLDQTATLEGGSKARLKFSFVNDKGETKDIICEPHMKLCFDDANNGVFYNHRIYFYFGKKDIENHKILVAHIGEHL